MISDVVVCQGRNPKWHYNLLIVIIKILLNRYNTSTYTSHLKPSDGSIPKRLPWIVLLCSPMLLTGLDATYPYDVESKVWLAFPHQIATANKNAFWGEWSCKWDQRIGPFSFRAEKAGASLTLPILGPMRIILSASARDERFVLHHQHFFNSADDGNLRYAREPFGAHCEVVYSDVREFEAREIVFEARQPGVTIKAIAFDVPQSWMYQRLDFRFDHIRRFLEI
jgi:hypothetical protein